MNETLKQWSMRMALKEIGQTVGAGSYGLDDTAGVEQKNDLVATDRSVESVVAFSRFVELMRRKKGLTVEQLAESCGVEVAEIIGIEDEVIAGIGPRTVYQLAKCFDVSDSKLMQLAGLMQARDSALAEQSMRFAARSNSMASLTKEERDALDEFVAQLGK